VRLLLLLLHALLLLLLLTLSTIHIPPPRGRPEARVVDAPLWVRIWGRVVRLVRIRRGRLWRIRALLGRVLLMLYVLRMGRIRRVRCRWLGVHVCVV